MGDTLHNQTTQAPGQGCFQAYIPLSFVLFLSPAVVLIITVVTVDSTFVEPPLAQSVETRATALRNCTAKSTGPVVGVVSSAAVAVALLAIITTILSWRNWRSPTSTDVNLGQWAAHFFVYVLSGKSTKVNTGKKIWNSKDSARSKVDARVYIKGLLDHPTSLKDGDANQTKKQPAVRSPACVATRRLVPLKKNPLRGPFACAKCGKPRQAGDACSSCTKSREQKTDTADVIPIFSDENNLEEHKCFQQEVNGYDDKGFQQEVNGYAEPCSEQEYTDSEWDYEEEDPEWSDDEDDDLWREEPHFNWESEPRAKVVLSTYGSMISVDVGKQPKPQLRLPRSVREITYPGFFGRSVLQLPGDRGPADCGEFRPSLGDV